MTKKNNKCPKCGSSDIEYDIKKKKLVCNYCHEEFEEKKVEQEALDKIEGYNISEGSKAIQNDSDLAILKCDNCGAEVIINVKDNNYRCHWCHSVLNIDSSIGNGMAADLILPFKITKEEATKKIEEFINERKKFSKGNYVKEFNPENIVGVYFPYFIVDCNAHVKFWGEGGHVLSSHSNDDTTYYDIEMSYVERDFDITIDDLQIEASLENLNKIDEKKTNNIINSIMPFDTENCVEYESNYLVGYNVEKRDLNVYDLQEKTDKEIKDIVKHYINLDLDHYDCGVYWKEESIEQKGKSIKSAYLPVWLYSYVDKKKIQHYIAINARTGEINGSVPFSNLKFLFFGLLVFILIVFVPIIIIGAFNRNLINNHAVLFILVNVAIGYAIIMFAWNAIELKYRNYTSRHSYEQETKNHVSNLKKRDEPRRIDEDETYKIIPGANNDKIEGDLIIKDQNDN